MNIKHVPQFQVNNCARLILFSNHTAPVSLEDGDRRYFVFNSQAKRREQSFYDRLYAYIGSDEGMNAIYSYFRNRDISGFNAYAPPPETEAKRQIIEDSQHPIVEYLIKATASGLLYQALGEEFSWFELRKHLKEAGLEREGRNSKELSRALEAAGVVKSRPSHGGRTPVYTLPPEACIEDEDDFLPRAPGSPKRPRRSSEY